VRVGYKLRREIEGLFPGPCTPAERIVGLEIADRANESTRISLIGIDELCSLTGLQPIGVRRALQRLLDGYGLQFRVSRGKGKDGRDVYSSRGYPPEYRVPSCDEFLTAHRNLEGGTQIPPSLPEGRWLKLVGKPP
jgi:hypothetical protein